MHIDLQTLARTLASWESYAKGGIA
jgi:hypothetical protein